MAKRIIDPQLAEALRANPNVEKVTRKSIVFKASFINRALDQYLLGGKPRIEIFEEARLHRLLQQRKAANRAWQDDPEGEEELPAFQAALPPGGRRGRAD